MSDVRKYRIKQSWIFNLESMSDKIACIGYDVEEGTLNFPFEIAGTQIKDWDDLDALREECADLEYKAWHKVIADMVGMLKLQRKLGKMQKHSINVIGRM